MGFPTDWNGSKFKIDIDGNIEGADLVNWTLRVDNRNIVLRQPNSILDGDGTNPMKPDGSDIRFSSDADGLYPVKFTINNAHLNTNPLLSKLDIAVRVPYVSISGITTIYMWWGNQTAVMPIGVKGLKPLSDKKLSFIINTI